MTKSVYLEKLKLKTKDEILYLCCEHMLDKIYNDSTNIDEDELKEFFSNYKNYHLYLNDFAGTIYNRYGSHVNQIYVDMCSLMDVDVDNQYTLEHTIIKLERQTPQLLLSLTNEDIQHQTIEHFDEKLENIENSTHYVSNQEQFKPRVDKLYKNISLVKNALGIK